MEPLVSHWSAMYPCVSRDILEEFGFHSHNTNDAGGVRGPMLEDTWAEALLQRLNGLEATAAGADRGGNGAESLQTHSGTRCTDPMAPPIHSGDLVVFTTSMTASRRVRADDRRLRALLAALSLPHDVLDIADNPPLQRAFIGRLTNGLHAYINSCPSGGGAEGDATGAACGGGGGPEGNGGNSGDDRKGPRLPMSGPVLSEILMAGTGTMTMMSSTNSSSGSGPVPAGPSPAIAAALTEAALPVLFFKGRLVGTYEDIQYLVDEGPAHTALWRELQHLHTVEGCE